MNTKRMPNRLKSSIIIIFVYIVLVSIIIGLPYYRDYISPGKRPILKIGSRIVTLHEFADRTRHQRQARISLRSDEAVRLLGMIQREELIREMSNALHIAVSDSEIDQEVRERINSEEHHDPDFKTQYRRFLREIQMEQEQYVAIIRAALLEKKLLMHFYQKQPDAGRQVHLAVIVCATADEAEDIRLKLALGQSFQDLAKAHSIDLASGNRDGDMGWIAKGEKTMVATGQIKGHGILVETHEEALAVIEQLERDEAFESLARRFSLDTVSGEKGGYLGWVSTDTKSGKHYAAEAFELKPGEISHPIKTQDGFWVIRPAEKSPEVDIFNDYIFQLPVGKMSPPLKTPYGYYLIRVLENEDDWPYSDAQRWSLARREMEQGLTKKIIDGSRNGRIAWYWNDQSNHWLTKERAF